MEGGIPGVEMIAVVGKSEEKRSGIREKVRLFYTLEGRWTRGRGPADRSIILFVCLSSLFFLHNLLDPFSHTQTHTFYL